MMIEPYAVWAMKISTCIEDGSSNDSCFKKNSCDHHSLIVFDYAPYHLSTCLLN